MFLIMKISPGSVSVNSFGGTLESEHPMSKYFGFCPWDNLLKYYSSVDSFFVTYSLFPSRTLL